MANRVISVLVFLLGFLLAFDILLFAYKIIGKDLIVPDCTGQCIREPHDENYN